MWRKIDVVLRHNQIGSAVEIKVFEDAAPGKFVVGDFYFVRGVGEFEITFVVKHNPIGSVGLLRGKVALRQKRGSGGSGVGKEEIDQAIVVVISDGDSHRIAVYVRRRILDVFKLHSAVVFPCANLARIVGDDQVFVAVLVGVEEDRLKRVVLVRQARLFGFVGEGVVAIVDQ